MADFRDFSLNATTSCRQLGRSSTYDGRWRFFSGFADDLGFGSMLTLLAIPAIDGQDNETDDGSSPPPLVAHLLEIAPAAVHSFDVIVGADALSGRAVQVGDHFVELVGRQHGQGLSQIGIGQELRRLDEGRTPTTGLTRTLV